MPSIAVTSEKSITPEGIRTPDRRIRNPLLYPAELRALDVYLNNYDSSDSSSSGPVHCFKSHGRLSVEKYLAEDGSLQVARGVRGWGGSELMDVFERGVPGSQAGWCRNYFKSAFQIADSRWAAKVALVLAKWPASVR